MEFKKFQRCGFFSFNCFLLCSM